MERHLLRRAGVLNGGDRIGRQIGQLLREDISRYTRRLGWTGGVPSVSLATPMKGTIHRPFWVKDARGCVAFGFGRESPAAGVRGAPSRHLVRQSVDGGGEDWDGIAKPVAVPNVAACVPRQSVMDGLLYPSGSALVLEAVPP
jgi:hypothetical protein